MLKLNVLIFTGLFFCVPAIHADPVKVMVLDSPVDVNHHDLSAIIDTTDMKAFQVSQNLTGKPAQNLLEYNNSLFVRNQRIASELHFGQALADLMYGDTVAPGELLGDFFKVSAGSLTGNRFKIESEIFGTYLHGTHVAALATRTSMDKPASVQLSVFPLEMSTDALYRLRASLHQNRYRFSIRDLKTLTNPKLENEIADQIVAYIHAAHIQVVNASLGTNLQETTKLLKEVSRKFAPLFTGHELKEMAKEGVKADLDQMRKIIQSCPETLFVFAAGNDGRDLDRLTDDMTTIQAPNVIFVAATDGPRSEKLAKFSDFNADRVQIAAYGLQVNSARAGTQSDYLKMSGTSMASPVVVNEVVEILKAHPGLQPAAILSELYSRATEVPALANRVQRGRVLKIKASSIHQ